MRIKLPLGTLPCNANDIALNARAIRFNGCWAHLWKRWRMARCHEPSHQCSFICPFVRRFHDDGYDARGRLNWFTYIGFVRLYVAPKHRSNSKCDYGLWSVKLNPPPALEVFESISIFGRKLNLRVHKFNANRYKEAKSRLFCTILQSQFSMDLTAKSRRYSELRSDNKASTKRNAREAYMLVLLCLCLSLDAMLSV